MEQESLLNNFLQELKRGTLVLAVLMCTEEPGYGYALVRRLQEKGIDIEQNTLYPLLRRLEKQELLQSCWETEEARQRRYYKISPEGKNIRNRLLKEWKDINLAIEGLKSSKEGEEV